MAYAVVNTPTDVLLWYVKPNEVLHGVAKPSAGQTFHRLSCWSSLGIPA